MYSMEELKAVDMEVANAIDSELDRQTVISNLLRQKTGQVRQLWQQWAV